MTRQHPLHFRFRSLKVAPIDRSVMAVPAPGCAEAPGTNKPGHGLAHTNYFHNFLHPHRHREHRVAGIGDARRQILFHQDLQLEENR